VPLQSQVGGLYPQHLFPAACAHAHLDPPVAVDWISFALDDRDAIVQISAILEIAQYHAVADCELVLPGRRRAVVQNGCSALECFGDGRKSVAAPVLRLEGFYCCAKLLY
jgi:hypothetical protein